MRARTALLAASLAALAVAPTRAQTLPSAVGPGARVRVRIDSPPPPRTVIGTVRAPGADTLVLAPADGGPLRYIPTSSIDRLEVSRGRGVVASHVLIGAVAGAAIGGVVAGTSSSCAGDDPWCRFWRNLAVLGGVGLGGVVGAGVGALIKGEKWMAVPLEHRVSIAPLPHGGVGVGLTVEF